MTRVILESYCGIYCGACPDDDKDCQGCKADVTDSPECPFRLCNLEKGTRNCSECSTFPCEKVQEMMDSEWPHHRTVLPNLERIKKIGVDIWLSEQDAMNRCKSCGKRQYWYRSCCGEKADSAEKV